MSTSFNWKCICQVYINSINFIFVVLLLFVGAGARNEIEIHVLRILFARTTVQFLGVLTQNAMRFFVCIE